jgi:hypothetical protein
MIKSLMSLDLQNLHRRNRKSRLLPETKMRNPAENRPMKGGVRIANLKAITPEPINKIQTGKREVTVLRLEADESQ